MASVERESQSSALATLSNTLELFDTFKSNQDDDKDSDEESFHLPMLDCDDDLESNSKDLITSEIKKQNGESEDEILNKFATTATRDLDPKMEESLLSESVEIVDDSLIDTEKENCEENAGHRESPFDLGGLDVDSEENITAPDNLDNDGESNVHDAENENNDENTDDVKSNTGNETVQADANLIKEGDHTPERPVEEHTEEMSEDGKDAEESIEEPNDENNSDVVQEVIGSLVGDKIIDHVESEEADNDMELTEEIQKPTDENESENEGADPELDDIEMTEDDKKPHGKDGKLQIEEDNDIHMTEEFEKSDGKVNLELIKKHDGLDDDVNMIEEVEKSEGKGHKDLIEEPDVLDDDVHMIDEDEGQLNTAVQEVDERLRDHEDKITESDTESNADMKVVEEHEQSDDKEEILLKELVKAVNESLEDGNMLEDSEDEKLLNENNDVTDSTNALDSDCILVSDSDGNIVITGAKDCIQNKSISPECLDVENKDNCTEKSDKPVENCTTQISNTIVTENEISKSGPDVLEIKSIEVADIDVDNKNYTDDNEGSELPQVIDSDENLNLDNEIKDSDAEIDLTILEENKLLEDDTDQLENKTLEFEDKLLEDSPEEPTKYSEKVHSIQEEPVKDNQQLEKSEKDASLACDDLLDISVIRDADEDNACAIAENASDKSDNDDQDDDKAENEIDSEGDAEENLLSSDKDDHMDFEDGNSSNLADQDTATNDNLASENTSDSENRDDAVMKDSGPDLSNSAVLENKKAANLLEESVDSNTVKEAGTETSEDNLNRALESDIQDRANGLKYGKRHKSDGDKENELSAKKIRLSVPSSEEKRKTSPTKNDKSKTLITFEKFMQKKTFQNKLTREDLEQFCIQKICEAIMHETDVGELHQIVKKQEQTIENLRKDNQQLTKQTRDLDIVNKKLINELKSQNGNKKPLVPLKITRSVGLQVKLNIGMEPAPRRKQTVPASPRTPNPSTPVNRSRSATPVNSNVARQVAASPRKSSTTPILSQALQNRLPSPAVATKRPAVIRPKQTEQKKSENPGVIDLTDEDDKASKTAAPSIKILNKSIPLVQQKAVNVVPGKSGSNKPANNQSKPVNSQSKTVNSQSKTVNNQTKTVAMGQIKTVGAGGKAAPNRTVTPLQQSVRLTPTHMKNGIAIPVTSASGTTQLMYVVQPSSLANSTAGGTPKAVLLNFQPTNGVLPSAINGSAVSVLPSKTTNSVLKTMAVSRKHPAALPLPPPLTLNSSLKPLLPKPHLSIRKTDTGIILQWRMPYNLEIYEGIASYQLFAYQETNAPPSTEMWRKVGDVKALALPMACTLTQFADKNKYYFAVRSVDVHKRIGAFSDPEEISL